MAAKIPGAGGLGWLWRKPRAESSRLLQRGDTMVIRAADLRTGADACVRYLTTKHEYLRYD